MENGTILSKQLYPSPHPRVKVSLVTYLSGGLKVKGFLAEPIIEQKYPGFLYLRGGIKNVGMVRMGRIVQFASEGFVVMAPFYRGNQGGEGQEDFAGEDRGDAIAALCLLKNHPKVQSTHIHVFGFSRGGVMALLTAIQCRDVASVVTWGGVSDMSLTYEERVDLRRMMKRVIGGTPRKVPDAYRERTPLFQIDQIQAPVLIIHGMQDKNVSIEHATRLEKALLKHKKKVESWIFNDYTHYFPPEKNREIVRNLTAWMKMQQ
ncbi:alpha/beta hydrolase family protein [Bacillus solimangrovi]|uniref:Peptidase n=1 Tax=Bacillus solimangrovi TaxID=1305675 RepID=A0A1E5LDF6_9BACI|nr:prolyl oligopeptidase family serine peptidase [Bacillus solimangrovi]OEH92111.1 peptidase [Bacillus solimangrovi]